MCPATTFTKGAPERVLALALCCIALCAFAAVRADARQPPPPPTSPEKAALIKELVALTNAGGNAQAIMDSVTAEARKERERVFEMTLKELGGLSQAEREALMKKEREDSSRLNERIDGLFRQRLDLNRIVDEVSYVVYDRHFTAEELRDLLAFYRTPTGRKSIEVMPRLFADSMAETSTRLLPQLEPIMRQVLEEERLRVENILPPKPQPKPRPAKPPARRRQ